ncbi:MAG: protein translocase subunit SecD [Alphaproteobacteria bacterium]|nr:protein translocase subunit SecD [Alphaproteobacteria bacterium]
MIQIAPWKIAFIIFVCAWGVFYSLPNMLSADTQQWMKNNLPGWMPHRTVNLGLDLQGGAHLLYEVDVDQTVKERVEQLVQDARNALREAQIGYSRIGTMGDHLRVTLTDSGQAAEARAALRKIDSGLDLQTSEGNVLDGVLMPETIRHIHDQTLAHSIEIVRRRVDALGTTEPVIVRQGERRILIQAPGANAEDLKAIIGTTAKLTFHLVEDTPGAGRAFPLVEEPGQSMNVQRRAMITGEMLETAQPSFQDGTPVISFRLDNVGARRFCDVTRENVGRPFAIVLDNEIISAPVIRDAICGGQGVISGNFTVQSANNLAMLLRAGALPAPMKVVEERTVGPTLGSDSVEAGKVACVMALVFVIALAVTVYGLFGVFASIGLMVNMILIMAVMSSLGATLTLPGIAGIVLTIGLAIDGNVLIYERIKEELRAGRGVLAAIDTGYTRALTTITDSNLAALIAALILFSFGTGPIKGFAVTMCVGVITSYFSALMFTRFLILNWLRWARPKTIKV